MGYTTEFRGRFTVINSVSNERVFLKKKFREPIDRWYLAEAWRDPSKRGGSPNSYCQWKLDSAEDDDEEMYHYFEWDGGEKFYYYEEWLQFFLDNYLLPNGYTLSGQVIYQGEETTDSGYLYVEDGRVRKCSIEEMLKKQSKPTKRPSNDFLVSLIPKIESELSNVKHLIKDLEIVRERLSNILDSLKENITENGEKRSRKVAKK